MILTGCPDREVLADYCVGRLSAEQLDEVSSHIERCAECQAQMLTLEDASDTLVSHLRGTGVDAYLNEPLLEVAMEEAIELPTRRDHPAPPSQSLVPGVLGEYQLLEELGRGGMGRVYRARHTKLDREVALKILPRGRLDDPRAIARFEREMRAIGRLNHPHVVHAYDAREIDHMPVLIMEFVDGTDVEELAWRLGPLPLPEASEIVRQAALGLQYAHEHGLVHRDVKPSNLILGRDGRVKVLDLGLARFCVEPLSDEVTHSGQLMGTADYVAPEQVGDSRTVDIRADIYSLGCTLYRLLTGRPPYAAPEFRSALDKLHAHVHTPVPPITQFSPELPAPLVAVLHRMLAKQPDDRFDTPGAVAEALEPWATGADLVQLAHASLRAASSAGERPSDLGLPRPSTAAPLTFAAQPARWARHRWTPVVGLAGLIAVSFAAGVIVTIYRDHMLARLDVPEGSSVRISPQGDVDVTLPEGSAAPETAAPDDAQLLQGVWRAVAAEGRAGPPSHEAIAEARFSFEKDRFTWHTAAGPHGEHTIAGNWQVDTRTDPKAIRFSFLPERTEVAYGIYRLQGDRLSLVLGEPGGERPTTWNGPEHIAGFTRLELQRSHEKPPTAQELAASQAAADDLAVNTLNRLKTIGVALHMYHDQHRGFPASIMIGPDGQTPHSWRVALLPFLGYQEVYDQYRRDEPWDSPHNRRLLDSMPDVFRGPSSPEHAVETSVFALVGPETAFPGPTTNSRLVEFIDGTSRTVLLVRAKRAVPWTKPEDIAYSSAEPLPDLGGYYENGFHAIFADGAVRFLPTSTDERTLRALISRSGAEPVELPPPLSRLRPRAVKPIPGT